MKKVLKTIGIFTLFLGVTVAVLWAVFIGFGRSSVPFSKPEGTEFKVDKRRTNILILGADNRENEVARTDTIMLASIDNELKKVSIISIPRDTRVELPGVGLTKINHANAVGQSRGGIHEGTIMISNAVSNLLGVNIDHYVKVDFKGFKKLVDTMGGVEVTIPYDISDYKAKAYLKKGTQTLNGEQALGLARARYTRPNGDFDRQQSQFMLLSAMGRKLTSLSNVPNLPEQLNVIYTEILDTSISKAEAIAMGLNLKGIEKESIVYYQLPGNGLRALDPLVKGYLWYYEPDRVKLQEIMNSILYPPAPGTTGTAVTVNDGAKGGVNP